MKKDGVQSSGVNQTT